MAIQSLTDMTLDDLKILIRVEVDQRLQESLKPVDSRSVQEINDYIRQNRWTPPENVPSNLELLREDRDQ